MARPRKPSDIAAIFVHAGAGFHSYQNEKTHLQACESAARVAMLLLKNGGSAVDAVEIAIRTLEDNEITNSGYGSNLTMDGIVECDATIVDHLGRSGAVGAVATVKNPISAARVILDASRQPLSLQRVPPNFLAGSGAADFAYDNGLITLPEDALVSPAGRARWTKWQRDLQIANLEEAQEKARMHQGQRNLEHYRRPSPVHAHELLTAMDGASQTQTLTQAYPIVSGFQTGYDGSLQSEAGHGAYLPTHSSIDQDSKADSTQAYPASSASSPRLSRDTLETILAISRNKAGSDVINDTVGAIAVDSFGNIAAGSSSGGIGMKHRGRVGPAALVGVGTAVIPVDPRDPEKSSVAAVTSGTGEHIATTLAASTCASRIYNLLRQTGDGTYEEITEGEALRTMIELDFLSHPGVVNSPCQAAIGVMAVKKTDSGVYLYFGHNTDSFAIASMSSEDKEPVCVMSRRKGNGGIAQGGRACRAKRLQVRNTYLER